MYKHEMTLDEHILMVKQLLELKGKVLLSGYWHPAYEPLEKAGWQRKDFSYAQGGALAKDGKLSRKIESVWLNYNIGGSI